MTMSITRSRPVGLVALVALVVLGGALFAGLLGVVAGAVAGLIAALRPRLAVIACAVALVVTAVFTLVEQPLTVEGIAGFPVNRPLASAASAVAGVLLLGVVAAAALNRGEMDTERLEPQSPPVGAPPRRLRPSSSARWLSAVVDAVPWAVAGLAGSFLLSQVGDRRWEPLVPAALLATGVAVTVVAGVRVRAAVGSGPSGRSERRRGTGVFPSFYRSHVHLLGGSVWLLATTLTVSVGSFIFWVLVAQRVPADDVGRATALFSATLFITYATSLGLPIAVGRYASAKTRGAAVLFTWSLVLTVASSVVGVLLFAVLAPTSIREGLDNGPVLVGWFVVFLSVAGQSVAVLVDVRLMALRRWSTVFLRSLLIAVLRLPFLLWLPSDGVAFYVYAVAIGGFAVTGVLFLLPLAREDGLPLLPLPATANRAARFAAVNYLGQLAVQAPYFAVPLLVLTAVDAVENAQFYVSWGVMSVVYVGVQMIAQVLLVEGGRDGADHRQQVVVTLGASLSLTTVATLASLLLGSVIADLYGPDFDSVSTFLPLLVAGTIPFSITTTLLTHSRIRERAVATVIVTAGFAASVLIPTSLLIREHGALGAAWGWTIGNTVAALIAAGTTLLSRSRPTRPDQTGLGRLLMVGHATEQQQAVPCRDLAQARDAQDPRL
jgi:O-antigen/teichoic acid export membrane protein